jgi:hypothetical protein
MISAIVGEALLHAVGAARWGARAAGLHDVADVLGAIGRAKRRLQAQEAGQQIAGSQQTQPAEGATQSDTVDSGSSGDVAVEERAGILGGLEETGRDLLEWLSDLG